jgi:hypothetical protein
MPTASFRLFSGVAIPDCCGESDNGQKLISAPCAKTGDIHFLVASNTPVFFPFKAYVPFYQ